MNYLSKVLALILFIGSVTLFPGETLAKTEAKKTQKTKSKSTTKKTTKKTSKKPKLTPANDMKFAFANIKLRLKITKSQSAPAGMKFIEVQPRDDHSAVIKFVTPQFKDEPDQRVPAILFDDFQGEATLLHDIRALEYGSEPTNGNREIGVPRQLPLSKGILYFWITPTKGAANYYYLQHPQEKNIAVRIGPMSSLVDKEFTIDWADAKWSK